MAKKFDVSRVSIATIMKMLLALMIIGMWSQAGAALNTTNSHIINLYLLNEGVSGEPLNNLAPNSFFDSAITGTPQNHDDASSWPAPVWGSGSDFAGIGDSNGLTFSRDEGQLTRFRPWMNVNQGDYVNGQSFTIMVRMYASSLIDGNFYGLIGSSSNNIDIQGISGNRGAIWTRVREGVGGGETSWYFDSYTGTGGGVTGNGWLYINPSTWYNLFFIYEADAAVTIAIDDGTTFGWIKTTEVPADFSTVTNGYSDADRHFELGNNGAGVDLQGLDGRIESVVIWDKALTITEAGEIGLTNETAFIPEDCADAIAHGYRLAGDLNSDCHVDFLDLAGMAEQWLLCNIPGQSGCIENW
ncbi:MAG: hypothetical protein ACYC54_12690 [Sedimentisphaerales bacterium]